MEPAELDTALEELETRLDRLRALYEQYFIGIEKLEPLVPRKEVDRRLWQLRRMRITNTAKRFKLQTLVQRYNTFQQYWRRICREIEQGTYKRHVAKAEKLLGASELKTAAARRRHGRRKRDSDAPPQQENAKERTERELAELLDGNFDPVEEIRRATEAAPEPAAARQPLPPPRARESSANADSRSEKVSPSPTAAWDKPPMASHPRPGRKPLAARSDAQPAPQASPAKPKPVRPAASAAKKPAAGPQVQDPRIKELHARFLAARGQTRENGRVSVERLAKTVRDAETKLRQRHGNRKIDFDVIIKNGKAVVKPIVR